MVKIDFSNLTKAKIVIFSLFSMISFLSFIFIVKKDWILLMRFIFLLLIF